VFTFSAPRIFLYKEPTDMRKSFEGLSAAIEHSFGVALTSGAIFVFINKVRDRMKVLYWDTDGLAIWYKRLEVGSFPRNENTSLNRREFLMLLEGIKPKKLQKRYSAF
jgi:transposase